MNVLEKMYPSMAGPYGLRNDGTRKERGFLGELKRPDGNVMTEYSIGLNIDGVEREVPTLVPTLTKAEVQQILRMGDNDELPESIVRKAEEHARQRLKAGKSPFWNPEDDKK